MTTYNETPETDPVYDNAVRSSVSSNTDVGSVYDTRGTPCSGEIKASDIQDEFGGSNPISLSEYYGSADGVPASGTIKYSDMRCKSSGPPPPPPLPNFPRYGGVYVAGGVNLMTFTRVVGGGGGGRTGRGLGGSFDWSPYSKPSNMKGGTTFMWHGCSAQRNLFEGGSNGMDWEYTDYRNKAFNKSPNNTDNLSYSTQSGFGYEGSGSDDLSNWSGLGDMGDVRSEPKPSYTEEFEQGDPEHQYQNRIVFNEYDGDPTIRAENKHNILKSSGMCGIAHSSSYRWGDVSKYRNSYVFPVSGATASNEINVTIDPLSPFGSSLSPGSQVVVFLTAFVVNASEEYSFIGGGGQYDSGAGMCTIWGISGYTMNNIEDTSVSLYGMMAIKYKPQKTSDRLVVSLRPSQDQPSNARMIIQVSRIKTGWL